jgi:hypothetical protein
MLSVTSGMIASWSPSTARAAPNDSALAESLFRDAKRLMAKKRFVEACPKLAESQRLDPGGGTLLTLALCHEGEGKFASAWSEFTEAAAIAKRDGRADREKIANQHTKSLEAKLSYIVLAVPSKVPPGFELRRDDTLIGEAAWQTQAPIDPGEHVVSAKAPGKKAWSTTFTVRASDKPTTITVPELEDDPTPPALATATTTTTTPGSTSTKPETTSNASSSGMSADGPGAVSSGGGVRTAGIVVGAIGIIGLGVGGFFGLRASSQVDDANKACPDKACANPQAVALNEDGNNSANVANVVVAIGGAALIAGVIMIIVGGPTTSSAKKTALAARTNGAVFRW